MAAAGGRAPRLTSTARRLIKRVIHRSPKLVAVNKWAGLVCQGAPNGTPLLNPRTLAVFGKRRGDAARLVHRLDKPTSGVLVFARTKDAARELSAMFADRRVLKEYWAVVAGAPPCNAGTMVSWVNPSKPVGKSGSHTLVPAPDHGAGGDQMGAPQLTHHTGNAAGGDDALTSGDLLAEARSTPPLPGLTRMETQFTVLSTSTAGEVACVRLVPETGLKHQLRIQCDRVLGTPILGDVVHGRFTTGRGLSNWVRHRLRSDGTISHKSRGGIDVPLMLHARSLTFPGLGDDGSDLVIKADPPSAFRRLCDSLGLPQPTDRDAPSPDDAPVAPSLIGASRWGL
mmetsp:Transcript_2922/g.8808  ORF Transcript_2922/g.8808 Transcript_2922/m.8808 type:complete len:341 (+) Transcript_2922:134-1156(+)|eukprot:CAMPEP_0206304816 /NCGR_PEP_ID=MMETSP0106_2-20121207/9941_1 /ASSEMBLY_ACC=CAM_ASM_000206 /TAXON_ID=81532 /ORGANISM="Acanthoeca-like sp., Strain 10tr" /LENGTH=340 /DNA_ID=CAMNT_0053735641 /DNA_START=114 /DNA_END=1136 /DNA_ORIENTATION=-